MIRVSRDGGRTWYIAIAETAESFAVVGMFEYANKPSRQILMWWERNRCLIDGAPQIDGVASDHLPIPLKIDPESGCGVVYDLERIHERDEVMRSSPL